MFTSTIGSWCLIKGYSHMHYVYYYACKVYLSMKYVMYHSLRWLDRCTSMGKAMGHCLCIAHVCLRIVPRFGFQCIWIWMHDYVMNVCSVLICLYERITHKYTYALMYEYVWPYCVMWKVCSHISIQTHMYDDLVNG